MILYWYGYYFESSSHLVVDKVQVKNLYYILIFVYAFLLVQIFGSKLGFCHFNGMGRRDKDYSESWKSHNKPILKVLNRMGNLETLAQLLLKFPIKVFSRFFPLSMNPNDSIINI